MADKKPKLNEEQQAIATEFKSAAALDMLAKSGGGKLLVAGLLEDIVTIVDDLSNNFPTLTLPEFIAHGASLKTKLDLARALTRSEEGKDVLAKLLKESLGQ